jgi:hypothetical protein
MQLHHRNDFATMSTSFGALTHDMQGYDFKARFESLSDSTTRLDTRGLLTREQPSGPHLWPTCCGPRTRWTLEAQEAQD